MTGIFRLLLFVFLVVFLFSCERIKPEPPIASELDTVLVPPLSVVNLPVRYRVSELQNMLNERINGTFVKKWITINEEGDSLYLEVSRWKDIALRREGRTLFYSVPLKIVGNVKARLAGVTIKNSTPVEAKVNLHLATTIGFDSRWNIAPKSDLRKIEWIEEPTVKIAFAKVKLRKPIESLLEDKESDIMKKADKMVQNILNTRKIVQRLWVDIQKPIRINKKGVEVWLKTYGEDLAGYLEDTEPDLISLRFQLKARTQIIYEGDSIPASNMKLPGFKPVQETSDSLVVYAHSSLRFDLANQILREKLIDKTLAAKGLSTSIKDIRVYGTPTGIAVEVKVRGDVNGHIYVRGTPVFDSIAYTFGVHDFDFDIDSENSLLSSADWLLHTTVLDMISKELSIDVKPLASRLPDLIMGGIERGNAGQKIDLTFDTLHIQPQVILTTKDNIQVIVRATGRASLMLEEKVFEKKKKVAAR